MAFRPPKILVVEDDEITRSTICAALASAGYDVVEAADGDVALARLGEADTPEMVFLDVGLPVRDGYEVLSTMRENPDLSGIPVVVVTGTQYDGRLSGAVAFLRKPAKLDRILELARDWCETDSRRGRG